MMRSIILSSLVAVSAANGDVDCPKQGRGGYAYLTTSEEVFPCSNTWDLVGDNRLIVAPFPLNSTSLKPVRGSHNPKMVHWLTRPRPSCPVSLLQALPKEMEVGMIGGHMLLSYDPSTTCSVMADAVTHGCDKVDVSFRDAWKPKTTQQPVREVAEATAATKQSKDEFVSLLNPNVYSDLLQRLSGDTPLNDGDSFQISTRQTYQHENLLSAEWISQYFGSLGLEVSLQAFNMPNGHQAFNVIGELPGTSGDDRDIVVVGAHYDSTSQSAATLAPGSVDNGSGTVAVMDLARAATTFGVSFTKTVHFIAFGGEEQGLYGSSHYVDECVRNGVTPTALTMDMTAYSNNFYGVTIEGTTNSAIQALMTIVQDNTNALSDLVTVDRSNNSFGSDHVPFQRAGFPAILCIQKDDTNYPHYHRTTDTFDKSGATGITQAYNINRGIAGALWDLAQ